MIPAIFLAMVGFYTWALFFDAHPLVAPMCAALISLCEVIAICSYGNLKERVEELEKKCNEKDGGHNA